jgi:hypothetical protein
LAQLDDTRLGLGTFIALKGACGKTTTYMSYRVEEARALKTLHDPLGLHPVWNPQTSVSGGVEALETLRDPSGLNLV